MAPQRMWTWSSTRDIVNEALSEGNSVAKIAEKYKKAQQYIYRLLTVLNDLDDRGVWPQVNRIH